MRLMQKIRDRWWAGCVISWQAKATPVNLNVSQHKAAHAISILTKQQRQAHVDLQLLALGILSTFGLVLFSLLWILGSIKPGQAPLDWIVIIALAAGLLCSIVRLCPTHKQDGDQS